MYPLFSVYYVGVLDNPLKKIKKYGDFERFYGCRKGRENKGLNPGLCLCRAKRLKNCPYYAASQYAL